MRFVYPFTLVLLLIHATDIARSASTDECRPVPLLDIQDAVHAAKGISSPLNKGDTLSGPSGYTVTKVMNIKFRGQTLTGIIATKSSPPTTLICFEGTDALVEGLQQMISMIMKKTRDVELKSGHRFKVIDYYWEAINIFKTEMLENSRKWNSNTKFIVTGHSLGGALASLYSLLLVEQGLWNNPDNTMINFGAPRHGDENFAIAHDELIPYHRKVRLVFDRDIIAHVPAQNFLSKTFFHTARETWIEVDTITSFKWVKKGWIWVP